MIFRDRTDAGRRLAQELRHHEGPETIVLALPRGGVVVGYEVACALSAPLDVVVARKLSLPDDPELGIGAIAPEGIRVLDENWIAILNVSEEELEVATRRETTEMQRRLRVFRGELPPLDLSDRTVILVDDGLATGMTARAAVRAIRAQRPAKLVLAVPVGPPDIVNSLRSEVDELVCPVRPQHFRSVGQFYHDFGQIPDEVVVSLLERAAGQSRGACAPSGMGVGRSGRQEFDALARRASSVRLRRRVAA